MNDPGSASRLPVSRYSQAVERGLRLTGLHDDRNHRSRCPVDGPAAAQLEEDSDDVLFRRIQNSAHHVLHELLPHPNTHDYELMPRRHNL